MRSRSRYQSPEIKMADLERVDKMPGEPQDSIMTTPRRLTTLNFAMLGDSADEIQKYRYLAVLRLWNSLLTP